MDKLALTLAILALAIGGVGYWRSGGQQDVAAASEKIEEEVEELRIKQKRLAEDVAAMSRAAYTNSQERLRRAKERLVELSTQAGESLQKQVNTALEGVESLQERVAESLESTRDTTVAAAREAQQALAQRVRRLEARVDILQAKLEINRALARAEKDDFDEAEEYLREALSALKEARQTLGNDRTYETQLDEVEDSLLQAILAVKERADDTKSRIERVVANSDTLISILEGDPDELPKVRAISE